MQLSGFTEVTPILASGIYALVRKGKVIYVGKSRKMLSRIDAHRRKWVDKRKGRRGMDFIPIPGLLFDEIHVMPVPIHELDRAEREMIERYKPHYNVQLKSSEKVGVEVPLCVAGVNLVLNAKPKPVQKIERRV